MADLIQIYTDGSSLGNPGPGGFGVVMKYKQKLRELSGGFKHTTNNRMELLAVIEALKALKQSARDLDIIIYTDSKYVRDAIEKGWVHRWVRTGFKDKANPDLWRKFLQVYPHFKVQFEWVKGHSGIPENERCDNLAKKAAKGKNLKDDTGYQEPPKLL